MSRHVLPEEWVSPTEASVLVGVDRRTIGRWMADGTLPYYVLASGRRRIYPADLASRQTVHKRRTAVGHRRSRPRDVGPELRPA